MRNETNGQFGREDAVSYFNRNYVVDGQTGCWNWTGPLFDKGYGYFKNIGLTSKRSAIPASRAAWLIFKGPLTARQMVCHKCDNRRCVNYEDHLFIGSGKINMQDCKAKGRINRGEDRPQSKLTEDDVREIRRLRQGGMAWRALAEKYGVYHTCIVSAATGKTWSHVDEPIPTYLGRPGAPRKR